MAELIDAPGGPSHPHFIGFDPVTGEVVVADLGLDRVVFFGLGADELGRPNRVLSLPSGCGPRRLAFSRDGERLFVLGELDATVSVFRRSGGFELEARVSTLPDDDGGRRSAAELLMSDDGGVLYTTNRGDDSIAILDIAQDALRLVTTVPAEVRTPRGAAVTPTATCWSPVRGTAGSCRSPSTTVPSPSARRGGGPRPGLYPAHRRPPLSPGHPIP